MRLFRPTPTAPGTTPAGSALPGPPVITQLTLENYRCFQHRQQVRLAPLTPLAGENSTGKTSFLAMLVVFAAVQRLYGSSTL